MFWNEIVKYLSGSAVLGSTALLAAAGYIAKLVASQVLKRNLARVQGEIKRQNDERVEYVKSALKRVERLESDLLKSRDDAYGDIWKLTGAVNLFGAEVPVDCGDLSTALTNWYFAKGWLLTSESKPRYFLLQEMLNLLILRSVPLHRLSDERLFGSDKRTIDVLREFRSAELHVEARGDDGHYSIAELADCLSYCKSQLNPASDPVCREFGWLALQFVLSAFRSRLVDELGSREMVQASSAAEEHRIMVPMHVGDGEHVVSSSGAKHSR